MKQFVGNDQAVLSGSFQQNSNSFLLEQTPFQKGGGGGGETILTELPALNVYLC